MTTTDTTPLPDQVNDLAIVHLGAAYAAQVLHAGDTDEHVKGLRAAVSVANAAAAYLLQMLADASPQTAADAASYIDDAFTDPEHLHEWVTEQLVARGIDLGALADAARASAALGKLARNIVAADTIEKATELHNAAEFHRAAKVTLTVNGRSDDLIEIGGDLAEEFTYLSGDYDDALGDVVAFPDGTVVRVVFDRDGVWRITPLYRGHGTLRIDQVSGDDARSDVATLTFDAPAVWALHGTSVATLRPAGRR